MAAASSLLFGISELPGASCARTNQLVAAGMLMATLAAVHTHTVLGRGISGWRLFQPFRGGASFIILQICGWTGYGLAALVALCVMASARGNYCAWGGLPGAAGAAQLVAQVLLVYSLGHFEDAAWRQQARAWRIEGVPLSVVGAAAGLLAVAGVAAAAAAPPSRASAGWALLGVFVASKAAGLNFMWTLTWNLLTVCCFLIGSEQALAVMACIGVTGICVPWYLGRAIYWRQDFPERAMIGLSKWGTDAFLAPLGFGGWYLHETSLLPLRPCFWLLDTALHIVPGLMLLQHSADVIRPVHVLLGLLSTWVWLATLSLHYNVIDWARLWNGRLALVQWGNVSLYEPSKVANIYQFANPLFQDGAFEKACPGFLFISAVTHVVLVCVALLPNCSSIFAAIGGYGYVSTWALLQASLAIGAGGALCGVLAIARLLQIRGRTEGLRPKRD